MGNEVVGTARAMDCVSVIPAEGVIASEPFICYTVPSTVWNSHATMLS